MTGLLDLYVIASGLDHPEGIATGPDGELYAGGEAGQVYRIDRSTATATEIANTGGFVLGLCHDAAGAIYLCNLGESCAVLRVDPVAGTIDTWCDSAGGVPLRDPELCRVFAPDGSLYFTDSGTEDMDIQNGRLIRVPPGGGDGEVLDLGPLHFPNGMCVDGDGTAYFLETLTPRLSRVSGGRAEVIADLAEPPRTASRCARTGVCHRLLVTRRFTSRRRVAAPRCFSMTRPGSTSRCRPTSPSTERAREARDRIARRHGGMGSSSHRRGATNHPQLA